MESDALPKGFHKMLSFGLIEAILGRRSRRFFMGAEIPDGVFAYKSRYQPFPLKCAKDLSASNPNCSEVSTRAIPAGPTANSDRQAIMAGDIICSRNVLHRPVLVRSKQKAFIAI